MLKPKIWIFFSLFALGAILGVGSLLIFPGEKDPRARGEPADQASVPSTNDSVSDSSNTGSTHSPASTVDQSELDSDEGEGERAFHANRLLNEGDAFLAAGNFVSAADRYKKLQRFTGRFTSELSIRLGVCAEFEDQPGASAAHFRRALEMNPPPIHRWLALSGLSRTWIERGNRSEALHILCDLFLESLRSPPLPEEIQAQVNFQLGTTLQDITLQNYHYDLSKPDGVAFQTTPPSLAAIVELLNQLPVKKAESEPGELETSLLSASFVKKNGRQEIESLADGAPRVTILQRPTESIELTLVDMRSTLQPIAVLTKHLAAACELELFATPEAQSIITGRSKSLDVNDIQVSLLFDNLLLPLNLFWYQDEAGLHLASLSEKDSHMNAYWSDAMERTFRRFNVAFTGDYRSQSALLSRGNLNFILGDLDRASNQYQELSNLSPRDELLAKLFFNVGKVEMRLGRNENAIRHFYHAVDQTYDTGFQSTAYWLVGQLSLETNQLEAAIKTSGRALSTAKIDQQKRLAALTMARAYLLSNQPISANQILFNYRHAFEGTDLEPTAAVLGSYARYVGVADEFSRQTEANRLLASVAMAPDTQYENFLDIYVAARAYQELGFQEKAIEKLTLAADSTTIAAWRRQFLFELAVQLMIADRHDQAIPVFEFLSEDDTDQWTEKSLLQLAQLYVSNNRYENCIAVCERLWARKLSETDKQTTLNSMGRAYRELGEHHSAALCFSGMLPPSVKDSQ